MFISYSLQFWQNDKVCNTPWKTPLRERFQSKLLDTAAFAPDLARAPLTGMTDHIVLHNPEQSPNVCYPKTPFFGDSFICPHRILLFTKIETNSQYLFL